jgi:hypothetical protein
MDGGHAVNGLVVQDIHGAFAVGHDGSPYFKFGFGGLWPKFGIRNSEFGIKERGGISTLIISVNIVDRKGFFENAEVRLQVSLSSPRNSEFRIPNSELDRKTAI